MQILLANAKIMFEKADRKPLSVPLFQAVADELAAEMAHMSVSELARQLDCSQKLAAENWQRYQNFQRAGKMPALLAFNGQAYKHLRANTLGDEALAFAQEHLWITCFLYGLLRPMDGIVPYRMEHCVSMETTHDKPVNQYWKDKLTDLLIERVSRQMTACSSTSRPRNTSISSTGNASVMKCVSSILSSMSASLMAG